MDFSSVEKEVLEGVELWEGKLLGLSEEVITTRRNKQKRSIRQILGHMVDSASNNTHRMVHLQYGKSPLEFPNYATQGNNDRWIAIQNYQEEDWHQLVQLWKYCHLHILHVIRNVDSVKLEQQWISGQDQGKISLREMIEDFPRHFHLHLDEMEALIQQRTLWE